MPDLIQFNRPYSRHFLDIFGMRGISENSCALDIGSGSELGDLPIIRNLGAGLCVGIDIVWNEARRRESSSFFALVQGDIDGGKLPFVDDSFDYVILNNVIEHLHNPVKLLQEIRRVLVPGGLLAVLTPNQANLKNRLKLLLGGSIYFPLNRWLNPDDHIKKHGTIVFTGHIREYTANEIISMLSLTELNIISTQYLIAHFQSSSRDAPRLTGVDSVERISQSSFIFKLYRFAERLHPGWRYMISVVAEKH
jgi:SAM-dependent methyltransferase